MKKLFNHLTIQPFNRSEAEIPTPCSSLCRDHLTGKLAHFLRFTLSHLLLSAVLALTLCVVGFNGNAFGAWTYEQLFNTLNDGNLNGQDSWSGDGDYDVQTDVKYEGAKAVKIIKGGNGSLNIYRDITAITDGLVYVAMRVSTTTIDKFSLRLQDMTWACTVVEVIFKNGKIEYSVGEVFTEYSSFNADQWYVIAIEFDDTAQPNKFRMKVHDGDSWGAWTDWVAVHEGYNVINQIFFVAYGSGGAFTAYFDTITPTDPVVAPPTVTTQAASSILDTTATGNGTITNTGGEEPSSRGVEWGTSTGSYSTYVTGSGSPFTASLVSLPTGTTIYCRAKAYNSAGWGYGGEVSFLTKPAAPTGVLATDGSYTDKVTITWATSTGATGYQVYRDGTPLGWLGVVATGDDTEAGAPSITPGTAAATDGGSTAHVALSISGESADNGAIHTYKVRARNATGESTDSSTNTGHTGPEDLTYQWQRTSVDISGANTASYDDTAAGAGGVPNTMDAPSASTNNSAHVTVGWTAPTPPNGTQYTYRCRLNATGCSQQYSATDTGYRGAYPIDNYDIYRAGGHLTYDAASPYNDTTAAAPNITGGTTVATDGTHTDKVALSLSGANSIDGTSYSYTITAHNASGWGSFSTGDTGYRKAGDLSYLWYKSSGDSDGSYSSTGVTDSTYDDTAAPAPTITPGSTVATDGDHTDKVALSLNPTASANVGAGRYYYCALTAPDATAQNSSHNRGHRGVGSLTYQWQMNNQATEGGTYGDISGTAATYDATEAPPPTITAGSTVASDGTSSAHVALGLSGTSGSQGATRWFKCVLNATGASQQTSTANDGYRKVGSLTYQWQRTDVDDSGAAYSNIGTGLETYNDTDAPIYAVNAPTSVTVAPQSTSVLEVTYSGDSVTEGAGRWYKCYLTASGATSQYSSANRGYRNDTIAGTDGYEIFSDTVEGGGYTTSEGLNTASPFDDTGLSANTRKYYKVKAKSTAETWSDLSTSYDGKYTLANAPTTMGHSDQTTAGLKFTWSSGGSQKDYAYGTTDACSDGTTGDIFLVVSEKLVNTPQTLYVAARNNDDVKTSTTINGTFYTSANIPSTPAVSTHTINSMTWTWTGDGTSYTYKQNGGSDAGALSSDSAVSGLSPDTSYYIEVRALNGDGDTTLYSAASTAAYTSANPPTNMGHDPDQQSPTNVRFSWDSGGVQTDYAYGTTSACSDGTITNFYLDVSGTANVQKTLYVCARNGDGDKTSTINGSYYTSANTPGAPTLTALSSGSIRASIDENGNPSLTTFALKFRTGATTKYVQAGKTLGDSPVYQTEAIWGTIDVTGLSENTSYLVTTYAQNGDGDTTDEGSSQYKYTFCDDPTNYTATVASSTSISLSVDEFPNYDLGSSGYHWICTTNPGGGSDSTSRIYTDSGLEVNEDYAYTIHYTNGNGVETDKKTVGYYTLANVPDAPTVTGDYDDTKLYHCDITINAIENPATTGYAVQYIGNNKYLGFDDGLADNDDPQWSTSTTCYHQDLVPNTSYSYQVKARNGDGEETSFGGEGGHTFSDKPAISNISLSQVGEKDDTRIQISYTLTDAPGDSCSLQVEWSTSADSGWTAATLSGTTTNVTSSPSGIVHNASNEPLYWNCGNIGSTYYVRIKAHDGSQWGEWLTSGAVEIKQPKYDVGSSIGKCFIATAAYGTPLASEVRVLSNFRDQYLLTNPVGQALVRFYYSHSPGAATFISRHEPLRAITRFYLKPLVWLTRRVVNDEL